MTYLGVLLLSTPAPAQKNEAQQTHCPVMGGAIDSSVYTDIQGQRVYHCCPMCSDRLQADPDRYFEKSAAEGVVFQNIQTACPICGKPLEEKRVNADYRGRRIYLCCEECASRFEQDPEAVLPRVDEPPATGTSMQPESGLNKSRQRDHKH